jgi:hypothetical protein
VVAIARQHGRWTPGHDILVAPSQQILIRDWQAKALYGQAEALIPAAPVRRKFIRASCQNCGSSPAVRRAEAIYVGMELACAPISCRLNRHGKAIPPFLSRP